jgi:hypothetical protein
MITVFGAPETITYTPTYVDGYLWSLSTGTYTANADWACTGRMVIASDTIQISANTAHHVLFWDKNNTYMGYGNIASHYEGVAFLGDYVNDVVFPTGASKFALQVNKKGVNAQSYPDVSGNTYAELFADPSYLTFTDSVITGTLNDVFSTPLWLDYQTEYGDTLDEIFTPTLVTINNIGYSKTDLDNEVANFGTENITVLSLTQMITNGQFTVSSDWTGYNGTITYDQNGTLTIAVGQINGTIYQYITIAIGNYYIKLDYQQNALGTSAPRVYLGNIQASTLVNDTSLHVGESVLYTLGTSGTTFQVWKSDALESITIDNVSLFNSGSYTKSQIDTALTYTGYLPYNTAYSIPDFTDVNFYSTTIEGGPINYMVRGTSIGTSTEIIHYDMLFNDEGNNYDSAMDGSFGTGWTRFDAYRTIYGDPATVGYYDDFTAIDTASLPNAVRNDFIADVVDRDYYIDLFWDAIDETVDNWEWYSDKGITAGNQAYYLQLYADATANTERYEWYTQNGINQFNYAYNRAMFDNLTAWYGNGLSLVQLQNIDITYQREEVIPPVQLTMLEKLESYIDDLGVGQFGYVLISLVIMVLVGIGLALLHAPAVVLLIIEASFFLMFSVFGWFPLWLVILMAILLFVIIYITIKGGGSNG